MPTTRFTMRLIPLPPNSPPLSATSNNFPTTTAQPFLGASRSTRREPRWKTSRWNSARTWNGSKPDPQRLAAIEDRLALIDKLKRKYGPSLPDVIAYGGEVRQRLADIESADQQIEQVEEKRNELARRYKKQASALSGKRRQAAKRVKTLVEKELASLAMEKSVFEVEFDDGAEIAWSASGIDKVRLPDLCQPRGSRPAHSPTSPRAANSRVSPWPSRPVCFPPAHERSRSYPAPSCSMRSTPASVAASPNPSAAVCRTSRKGHQVLCVTHLPQVAGFADAHYFVDKREDKKKTFATIAELSKPERVAELARMLSGESVTASAVEARPRDPEGPPPRSGLKSPTTY